MFQNADLLAAQEHTASEHKVQLAQITEERQQIENELSMIKAQHEAALTKANKVMLSHVAPQPWHPQLCTIAPFFSAEGDYSGNAGACGQS